MVFGVKHDCNFQWPGRLSGVFVSRSAYFQHVHCVWHAIDARWKTQVSSRTTFAELQLAKLYWLNVVNAGTKYARVVFGLGTRQIWKFMCDLPCLQKQLIPAKDVLCENDSCFKIRVFSIWKHIYCGFFMQNFSTFFQLVWPLRHS